MARSGTSGRLRRGGLCRGCGEYLARCNQHIVQGFHFYENERNGEIEVTCDVNSSDSLSISKSL